MQVAAMQGGVLTLIVESAAWATRVRLATGELQRALSGLPEFTPLEKIRVKVAAGPDVAGARRQGAEAPAGTAQPRNDSP